MIDPESLWKLACGSVLPSLRDAHPEAFHKLFLGNRNFRQEMTEALIKNVRYDTDHLQDDECVEICIVSPAHDAGSIGGAASPLDRYSQTLVHVHQLPLRLRAAVRRAYSDARVRDATQWAGCAHRAADDGRLELLFTGRDYSLLNTAYYDILEDLASELNFDDEDDEDDAQTMPIFPEDVEWDAFQSFALNNHELIDHNFTMEASVYLSSPPDDRADPLSPAVRWQRKPRVRIVNFA
jgi:hypothetical protein